MKTSSRSPVAAALQPFVDHGWIAGAVTLVANKDRILAVDAIGYANLARKRRMTPNSLFWIASITKPITGAAFMILVDEGKVRVGDPVEKHLPEFADLRVVTKRTKSRTVLVRPIRKVSLRDILSHMSGMPMTSPLEKPTLDLLPLAVAARSYAMTPLESHPGRRYSYSNCGINTVGRVMEAVSGVPYEEFLARRLLKPLGMKDTTFVPTRAQLARLADPHQPNPTKTRLVETRIPQFKYPLDDPSRHGFPGGGLFCTARDLARFAQMILRGGVFGGKRYLSRAAIRQMTRRHTPPRIENGYGLGWLVEKDVYGHGGSLGSKMMIYPKRDLITIFLFQHSGCLGDGANAYETFKKVALDTYGA